ncbi:uncharacterized protein PG986_013664 [Apiospora aurea]|uniref:Uncharacterized protein n=1 Tax=Apiospora aurea TaxID=335848 RepID=A0ABR1PW66_9PEZI
MLHGAEDKAADEDDGDGDGDGAESQADGCQAPLVGKVEASGYVDNEVFGTLQMRQTGGLARFRRSI